MTAEKIYNSISEIRPEFLEEAENYSLHRRNIYRVLALAAACIFLCFSVSVPALAACDNEAAYELIYSVSPLLAQKLKPVRVSCEDNGIRMEVVAANLEGNTVNIILSMQDLTGNRITESSDLFDSYSIHTPYDQTAGCEMVDFDSETNTAFWVITIDQTVSKLKVGDKITFSVNEILSETEYTERRLDSIDINNLQPVQDYILDPEIDGCGGYYDWFGDENHETKFILPDESGEQLCKGVMLTGYGLINEKLHIQIKYEDVNVTDNNGEVYLKDLSGQVKVYDYFVSWKNDERDRYYEYVFDISSDEIRNYELWGEFWTCNSGSISGQWQVTFPIE